MNGPTVTAKLKRGRGWRQCLLRGPEISCVRCAVRAHRSFDSHRSIRRRGTEWWNKPFWPFQTWNRVGSNPPLRARDPEWLANAGQHASRWVETKNEASDGCESGRRSERQSRTYLLLKRSLNTQRRERKWSNVCVIRVIFQFFDHHWIHWFDDGTNYHLWFVTGLWVICRDSEGFRIKIRLLHIVIHTLMYLSDIFGQIQNWFQQTFLILHGSSLK
jgi:hypothetical protein